MSRLWADRLLVSIAPDSMAIARVHGRWRPRLVSKFHIQSENPLEALRAALAPSGKAKLDAAVVLSNRFVRYVTVPYDADVSGVHEELALARFHFVRVHGERAKSWNIRIDDAPPGATRLASAVDADLIPAIRAAFAPIPSAKLISVQPYLMAAYNRWRATLSRAKAWLVLPEPNSTCLAYVTSAGWQAARTLRGADAQGVPLSEAIQRERLRLAVSSRTALVHGVVPPAPAGWVISQADAPRIEGQPSGEDGALDMALCAL